MRKKRNLKKSYNFSPLASNTNNNNNNNNQMVNVFTSVYLAPQLRKIQGKKRKSTLSQKKKKKELNGHPLLYDGSNSLPEVDFPDDLNDDQRSDSNTDTDDNMGIDSLLGNNDDSDNNDDTDDMDIDNLLGDTGDSDDNGDLDLNTNSDSGLSDSANENMGENDDDNGLNFGNLLDGVTDSEEEPSSPDNKKNKNTSTQDSDFSNLIDGINNDLDENAEVDDDNVNENENEIDENKEESKNRQSKSENIEEEYTPSTIDRSQEPSLYEPIFVKKIPFLWEKELAENGRFSLYLLHQSGNDVVVELRVSPNHEDFVTTKKAQLSSGEKMIFTNNHVCRYVQLSVNDTDNNNNIQSEINQSPEITIYFLCESSNSS